MYDVVKRILDILLALLLLIPAALLFPFIAVGIILSTLGDIWNFREKRARSGDGIIFFRQKRVGKNGKVFDFIKFRSQRLGAEKISEAKQIDRDPRQYLFGTFLRKTYLDELPQIWNVLKGEMSFVGPRPERPEYVDKLKKIIPQYDKRHEVLPGITGLAHVSMENDASVEDAPEKIRYDLYYIQNRSLLLDLKILFKTIFIILRRQGR